MDRRLRGRWRWAVGTVGALAAAGLALLAWLQLRPHPLPDGILYANGQLEAVEVRVAAEVAGRVVTSDLVEGTPVGEGQLLLKVDHETLDAQLAEARADVAALGESRDTLGYQLETWRHHLHTASAELERVRGLHGSGAASDRQVDQTENAFEEARGRVGSLEAERRQVEARAEAARQRVAQLQVQLERTAVRSPLAGTVLTKAVEVGEFVSPGRVVAVIADLSRLELRVFVPERQVGMLRLGENARLQVDAFPEQYFDAVVTRIDQQAQFTPREVNVPEERVRKVFGVTLLATNPDRLLKPGMPADAWIRWKPEVSWPRRLPLPR